MGPHLRKRRRDRTARPRVLILLENLPLQRDARVRRECRALLEAGYDVSVICPRSRESLPDDLEAVDVLDYNPPMQPSAALGFLYEFTYSLVAAAFLMVRAARRGGFDVVQACNPPDLYFLLAAPCRLLGKPFVFDHHDLSPELFTARYGRRRGPLLIVLRALERATFATADHVIATNESIRQVALTRGRKCPEEVTVVRNGPELRFTARGRERPELRRGRRFLGCWLGVMGGVDDGVDVALRAVAYLVHELGRRDCTFAFIGDGEERAELEALAQRLDIADWAEFTGWLSHEAAFEYLASAHLGLSPDPKTPRLDVSTSIKVMEYMVWGLPVVAFDVYETRVSAGPAATYVQGNDARAYAEGMFRLLDDPATRAEMGRQGRERIEHGLAWDHQKKTYIDTYDSLLGDGARR